MIKPAETALKVVDVKTVPNINVGYIVGVGDQVPEAIQQLGAKLAFIDPDETGMGRSFQTRCHHHRRARL